MADSSQEQLVLHLTDMHALEMQSIKQLERASELAGDEQLQQLYKDHLEETQEHERLVRERIEAYDHEPSPIKDLTMRSGAIGLRQLADIPPDTPVKLAMHFYALENLEVAAYELLARIAQESGDDETAEVADKILEQERGAADKIADTFDRSVELMLEAANSQDEDADDAEETDEARSDPEAAHAARS
jgi:ferritin-like metal-binding protein YciE